MNLKRVTLSFDKPVEQVYQDYYYKDSITAFRFSFLLVTALYGVFGILDAEMVPDQKAYFYLIRYAVVVPFLTLTLVLSFLPVFRRIWQGLLLLCYLIAGGGILAMIVRVPDNYTYYSGLMLIFSAGYFFIKLRFFFASIAGIIILVLYNIFMASSNAVTPAILVAFNFFFISANLISMVGAYYLEVSYRRNFLLNRQLDESRSDLERINHNLESEVLKRTEELLLAKEKAEESDRLKSAFLANVSHEIRTPMNGILGFADLLKEPGLTGDEQQRYIRIIEKSGERMLNIIHDIIDISKIESGEISVILSETDVNEVLDFVHSFFKPEAEEKKLALQVMPGLSDGESVVQADREKLYAVLTNLVKNAIKYCDAGTITFGYESHNSSLAFFVRDTGPGIPSEFQESVFERFYQAALPGKKVAQGSGLGLAISKALVNMMGGRIWLESETGQGSTFYFTIPFVRVGD